MLPHSLLSLTNIGMSYFQKVCFEGFSASIHHGYRIALIGDNGSGKSTLLKCIQGIIEPSLGHISCPLDVRFGYVPQIIENFQGSSGGEQFNKAFTKILAQNPNILCLDEPTNHLDLKNKGSLMRLLKHYSETLIIISHDVQLLEVIPNEIWSIKNGKINIFKGDYKEYLIAQKILSLQRSQELDFLEKGLKKVRKSIQFEQKRQASSLRANIQETDRKLKGAMKEKGSRTIGKNQGRVNEIKKRIDESLQTFQNPEEIIPRFNLKAFFNSYRNLVSIKEGECSNIQGYPILKNITLQVGSRERMVILGNNGSGKSTLIKAILGDPRVLKEGKWVTPLFKDIGYLDQQYGNLEADLCAYELIKKSSPNWNAQEIRKHLNDFLFRKNEDVFRSMHTLSAGEKARLSMALIAAKTPKLLILDEITNNLDLKHKSHVTQVLKAYPGALVIISHDMDFLKNINIETAYEIRDGEIHLTNFA